MTSTPDLTLLQLEAIEYARQAMNLLHKQVCLECDECRCGHYDAVLCKMVVQDEERLGGWV
jgi:hypothetical protein